LVTAEPFLHLAIERGEETTARLFLQKGAYPDSKLVRIWTTRWTSLPWDTLLEAAVKRGQVALCQVLVEKGAGVKVVMEDIRNLFSHAVWRGDTAMVAWLVEKGADVRMTVNDLGQTPLHTAAARGHKEMAQVLIEKGADVDAKTVDGTTPLQMATRRNRAELVGVLARERLRQKP
jgi:ankyrin repeat protein